MADRPAEWSAGASSRRDDFGVQAATGRPGEQPPSIAEALSETTAMLQSSDSPRLDAELLLGHVLEIPREALLARTDQLLSVAQAAEFGALGNRRASGEPVAYLVGFKHFYDLELAVSPGVLVPRPETEQLAEWAVDRAQARRRPIVLDVGTGSGALALACAVNVPAACVHGTDTSQAALAVAASNAGRYDLDSRVVWHHGDLVPPTPCQFDVVVANLPYIGEHELDDVAEDVLEWEPHEALYGGHDGLDLIRRLIQLLPARLATGADVGLEIGWRQGPQVSELVAAALPGAAIRLHHDLAGHPRMVTAEGYPGQ